MWHAGRPRDKRRINGTRSLWYGASGTGTGGGGDTMGKRKMADGLRASVYVATGNARGHRHPLPRISRSPYNIIYKTPFSSHSLSLHILFRYRLPVSSFNSNTHTHTHTCTVRFILYIILYYIRVNGTSSRIIYDISISTVVVVIVRVYI